MPQEIEESKRWLNLEKEDNTYKRDLAKRIELIDRILENMKNPDTKTGEFMESKMNVVVLKINQTHDIFEANKLNSELRIVDWIPYQVCSNNEAVIHGQSV